MPTNNRLMDSKQEIVLLPDPREMRDNFVKQHFDVPGTVREVMNQTDTREHQHECLEEQSA